MAPYRPQTWALGGHLKVIPDVPITAVYLLLYIGGAITHMTIFQKNKRKGHKFLMSGALFGFCMSRIVTTTLRIASTCLPNDIPLSIAAAIFVAAGVVLIYVINLIFVQRIVRAQHQHTGWHPLFKGLFISIYVIIVLTLIMLITSVVQSYYTLNPNTHRIDRDIQLYGATMYAVISFLPIPIIFFSIIVPRRIRVDKFGSGRFRTKIGILLLSSAIICMGASYRAGTSWVKPAPVMKPIPWYFERVYFYVFDFTVEILVIYLYAFVRVDRRFHVPNGAHGAGSYRAGAIKPEESRESRGWNVYSEEETFDDAEDDAKSEKDKDLEAALENESETRAGLEYGAGPELAHPPSAHKDTTLRPHDNASTL